jgi:hypothetical protein
MPGTKPSTAPRGPRSRDGKTHDPVAGHLSGGTTLPLRRLRSAGSAATRGFALYRAGHDDDEKPVMPTGHPASPPQEAPGCACGLYRGDTTAWLGPPSPTN